ncbi:hypothetical protein ACRYCC_37850 [Actinomadura scrupuli]|uniref:hypothetical protein n=1 Tax=Actinomadura scrupuli TaxID=559629 RepID=UPI003D99858C
MTCTATARIRVDRDDHSVYFPDLDIKSPAAGKQCLPVGRHDLGGCLGDSLTCGFLGPRTCHYDVVSTLNNDLDAVLAIVAGRTNCRVHPAAGMPSFGPKRTLPAGLAEFYSRCGGLTLFRDSEFPWRVSSGEQLLPAGPRLLGDRQAEQIAADHPDDLSTTCHVIADDGTGSSTAPHVVIDLHPTRVGRCYATGWDSFGLAGDMPIIALDMTGLVTWLMEAAGDAPMGGHRPFGDAYRPTL